MAMTRFLLVRHGQTDWNIQRRIQGLTDIPLNDVGRTQAERLAHRLKEEVIHAAYSSHLSRAYETGQAVLQHHPHLVLQKDEHLAEMGMGIAEGRVIEEIHAEIGDTFWDDDSERAKHQMELLAESHARLQIWMDQMLEKHQGETVLLASHGGKLRRLLDVFSLTHSQKREMGKKYISNGSLSIVEVQNEKHHLALYSCDLHLQD